MKKKLLIIFLLVFSITLTGCFNGSNPNQNDESWWDNLGGGGEANDTLEDQKDVTDLPTYEDELEPDTSITPTPDKTINLSEITEDFIKIKEEGTYTLTGTYNGYIEVSGDANSITLILDNAVIKTKENQGNPAICFLKHSGTRILHIKENTTNTLEDSIGNTNEADLGNAIIQAKKANLDITGKGILNLNSKGEETTAIKVKKDLTITDTTININTNDNGIKAGSYLALLNTNINITCGNDGIKTDVEAETLEDGNEFTKDQFAGYLHIKNSNILIVSGDDGISANSYLKIDNTSEYTINITTNNGAPNTITETSSDNANGKAIRTSGITLVNEDGTETDLLSQTVDNYLLVILGGKFIINSNDDAITSKGNLIIDNGNFNISSGDDGIHAEYTTTINNGEITINKCYESIEGANVEIYNGTINATSVDDGINAANSDLTNWSYNIYIGGGNIVINANGDGIDSNGTVEIAGGDIIIWGPKNNGNAALDADRGILVNGGNIVACGPMGMVETPGNNSKQPFVVYNNQAGFSVGSDITIKDEDGNTIFNTKVMKNFSSIVFSLDSFVSGKTYTITIGSTTQSFTINAISTQIGNSFGPGGVRPPGGGGRPPR